MPDPLNWAERLVRLRDQPGFRGVINFCMAVIGLEVPASVRIGTNFRLPHNGFGVVLHSSTVIGNDVRVYPGAMVIRSDQHLPWDGSSDRTAGVTIDNRAVLGAGCKVMFRTGEVIRVGEGALIGANSVVNRSVPPGETWVGAPARKVERKSHTRTVNG